MKGKKNTEENFWNRVDIKDDVGCWEWKGSFYRNGYGRFSYGCKYVLAHRLSYLFKFGNIPKGMLVCHSCDNPSCVNPNHLFLGNHSDNMKDAFLKKRHLPLIPPNNEGENCGTHKLCNENVIEIRRIYSDGNYTYSDIAKLFNVSKQNICNIVNRKRWKHI